MASSKPIPDGPRFLCTACGKGCDVYASRSRLFSSALLSSCCRAQVVRRPAKVIETK